jgi:phosphatidylserine decarboxylase
LSIPDVSPEIPALHWRAMLHVLRFLPQGALSRGFGAVADTRLPHALRRPVLGTFARAMGIDASAAEHELEAYASINEFFVRRLRPGARSIDAGANRIVSPVDGVIGQIGEVRDGGLVQAKGRTYTAHALLADKATADTFDSGSFATIYLSPRHYHRIHAPDAGSIVRADHLPGALLPVNEPSVQHIDQLFPRNERLSCYLDTTHGSVAVVAVGAYNVGRISAAFDPAWRDGAWVTNRTHARSETRTYDPPIAVARGDEIMAFHLGSTVVMLFQNKVVFESGTVPGAEVLMGSVIGRYITSAASHPIA